MTSLVENPHLNDLVDDMKDDEEFPADNTGTSSSSNHTSSESDLEKHSVDIEKTAKRAVVAAVLVLLVGAAAASSFLYLGISNANKDMEDTFVKRAGDLGKQITGALNDYELACSWVHESSRLWRENNMTREQFRNVYDYISATGLEFYAMEWVPNVTNAERPAIEADAAAYYAKHDEYVKDYVGFRGLTPEDPESMVVIPRAEKPFYFPIQFFEPIESVNGLYHYDVYSAPWEKPSVENALESWLPIATPGFKIVASGEQESFIIVLYHPGVQLPGRKPRDLSNILIRIKDLLERAVRFQTDSLGVYLYDMTEKDGMFLGGMDITVKHDKKNLTWYPDDIPFTSLQGNDLLHVEEIVFGQRNYKMAVVPVDDTYNPSLTFVILGGILLFLASLLLAIWMINNMRRSIQMHRVITKAAAEASIVSNLFPASVRERMIQDAAMGQKKLATKNDAFLNNGKSPNTLCQAKLSNILTSQGIFGSNPIAELYPYTTIMFADMCGFTAWSSVREPSQVFSLLETVYHSFDVTAKRRRVFKVETVGDCYVAVAGLPDPRKDHAVVMARFASDCLERMNKLVKALETTLGPDTSDLGMRVGLHSGQVTAGVLRGDKGRFQLFGDTMNTASRMESTGARNRIHVSEATATLLNESGHEKWLTPRADLVKIKGKGELQTYWLKIIQGSRGSTQDSSSDSGTMVQLGNVTSSGLKRSKQTRLVDWNVEVLGSLLKKIVARRQALQKRRKTFTTTELNTSAGSRTVLDEVKEVIALPEFNGEAIKKQVDPSSITLDPEVVEQLSSLVTKIADGYRNNPFHNFEHASHVTMSVMKMMSRIVDPNQVLGKKINEIDRKDLDSELHAHTFGITSDPLTQFACAFSALIHDLDHEGVPNFTLVNEKSPLADKYNGKSVAEQNSVDLAWALLMSGEYEKLRNCICCDPEEFARFRQLVINVVLATDIMDKELGAARKARWNKAFAEEESLKEKDDQVINRKATIVIEHLIQASDISHTMQHWHIYVKWNERLFQEMYRAYKMGRLEKDPSVGWHQGEIGFFDFYIIPLAKKLFTCGVFGVSSDELLNYALINRKEWEQKGAQMVEQYLKNYRTEYEGGDATDRADKVDNPRNTNLKPLVEKEIDC